VEFAIGVDASVSYIGQPKRAGSAPPHIRTGILEAKDQRRVRLGRKPGRPASLYGRVADVGDAAGADGLPIDRCPAAAGGGIEFVLHHIVDDADLCDAAAHERDRYGKMRDATGEIGSAVDRIDHPNLGPERSAPLLAEERVPREGRAQSLPDEGLRFSIGGRDDILGSLELGTLRAGPRPEAPSGERARFAGDRGRRDQADVDLVGCHAVAPARMPS
jgi:hypothetical protein